MSFQNNIAGIQLLIRNADGSTGVLPEADSLSFALCVEDRQILTNIANSLGAANGAVEMIFNFAPVLSGTPTSVVNFTVPAGKKLVISKASAWGDVDAEISLEVNGTQIDGCRTTPAQLTGVMAYSGTFPIVQAGSEVDIYVVHFKPGSTQVFKGSIVATLENI